MRRNILTLALLVLLNKCLIAEALDFNVPVDQPTINAAVTASNAAGGLNTLTVSDSQTIAAAIANVVASLAISGSSPAISINFNGANRFNFAGTLGTYSVTDLILTGATNSALSLTGGNGLTITDVTLTANSATNGGAVNISGAAALSTISGSTFNQNTATTNGGAIYNVGTMNLNTGNTFSNNTAGGNGGAIANTGALTITSGNNFNNNQGKFGGAIHNSGNGVLTINAGVDFTGNIIEAAASHSQLGGGAIFNTGANALFNIDGATFTGNRATPAITASYGSGGAIYNVNSTANNTITNSIFDSNTSQKNGGAIYNGGNLTVGGSTFTGNTSLITALGGAIYSGGTLTLNAGNIFENNMAIDGTGGAVNAAGTFFEITSNEFTQNSARTGGAMAIGATSSTVSDCTFTENTSTANGGAIYVTRASTITGSTFDSNQAGGSGGAIQVSGAGLNFLFTDNVFTNNKANSGAAIAHGSGILVIDNCQFIANEAVTNSTVTLGITDTVTIGNSSFTNNITNGNSGGALNLNRTVLNLLPGNVFEGNIVYGVSSYGGGAIFSGAGTLTISDNQFISNSAPSGNSGAIHIQGSTNAATPTETFIEGSLFQTNHAGRTGGAVMNHQPYAIMTLGAGNTFDSNTAVLGGGAVSNTGQLTINAGNSFLNNSVSNTNTATNTGTANGGAVYSNGVNTLLIIDSAVFAGNSVENIGDAGSGTIINGAAVARGGAVVNNLSTNAANLINDSSFSDNSVLLEGINYYLGVLDVDYTLENGPIVINASSGGAIYNSGTLPLEGTFDFSNNSVAINDTTVLSEGVSLISGGGAIYNSGTMNISDSANFADNSITVQNTDVIARGGAIYNNGGALTINNGTFTNNSSIGVTAQGGAIYNTTGSTVSLTITGGDFDQNDSVYGGAVYNDAGSNFILNGGSFSTNTALGLGGAVYNLGAVYLNSTLEDITFSDNSANGTDNDIYGGTDSIININGSANSVVINGGIAGTGTINKSNAGTLLLNGDSSLYTGIFNQTGGSTIVSAEFFAGASNITGGIVEFTDGSSLPINAVISLGSSGTIDITGTTDIAFDGKLTGNGVINKTSSGTLSVNGDDSVFTGTFNQTSGDTIVSEEGRMFGGTNNISNSTLEVTTALSIYYNANLGDNAILNNFATTINGGTISTGNINFTGTDAIATFTKDSSLPGDVNYSLGKVDNGQTNTIVFNNADVMLTSTDYTGSTTYSFIDSIIDITSSIIRDVLFDNLNTVNSELSFALSFDREPSGVVLTSDTLTATNPTGDGTIGINIIKIVNDNDAGLESSYTAKVLNGLTFDPATTIQNISTIAYEYIVTVDPSDNTSILLTVVQAATENSLYKMNALDGDRGFNISFFTEGSEIYNIGQSLGITAEGTFVVQGFDTNPSHGVISGIIVDSDGQPTGEKGSLFKLSNVTDLTVANLTISDAFVDGNGSVVYIDNPDAVVVLENIFIQNNSSTGLGGAIYNDSGAVIINRDLLSSNEGTAGGAVYNSNGTLDVYASNLEQNSATGDGGAIYNDSGTATVNNNTFTSNTTGSNGGAIYNTGGELTLYNNSFGSNQAAADGGAIYNTDTATISGATSFTDNTAGGSGGAIYNSGTLNLDSDYGDIVFSGNTAGGAPNDIYNDGATINIDGTSGNVAINDGIAGTGIINKSNNGTLILGGENSNYTGDFNQTGGTTTVTGTFFSGPGDVSLINSTLNFGPQAHFAGTNNLTLDNAVINSINNVVQTNTINQLTLGYGGANFSIDANGSNATSDQYIIQNGIAGTGTINISSINFVGEPPTAARIPLLVFDTSNIDAGIIFTATDKEINTPVYTYRIISDGEGRYILVRIGSESAINKQAFRGQVATMSAYYNQLIINNILFDHVYLESETLSARSHNNKYAAINPLFAPYQYNREDGSLWYKTYTTFETLSMTQDIDVRNYNYGSLVGADFPARQLGDGWKFLPTTYIAYNGGHQTFDGVGMYQNGGQGGFMGTFMKDDAWISSFLVYGGGYNNEMQVEGFDDRTGNWFAGTALKTAYNYRAARNLIIQPTALVSYNIFGNQHWGSDFGAVSMVSGYLNGINVAPGLNFIYNKKTWGAYITTQYMYNINDKINGSVGTFDLPNLRMRHGYIEYGFGITKTWKERFLGYFQTTIRNAGRTGVTLQAGIAWKL